MSRQRRVDPPGRPHLLSLGGGDPLRVDSDWVDIQIQRLKKFFSLDLIRECSLMHAAMVPRCEVCLYVSDHDRAYGALDLHDLVPKLRERIREITGGQTTYHGGGDYVPPAGVALDEDTRVLETFLPAVISDTTRDRLINLFIWVGYLTNQDVVQVSVRDLGYWIPTGSLIDAERAAGVPPKGVTLMAG